MQDHKNKKELEKIPNVDKNGEPIYKIDGNGAEVADEKPDIGDISNTADESQFKDTPQDLKLENSQE